MNWSDGVLLPGIGWRFDLQLGEGTRLAAVVHNSGRCDVYYYEAPDSRPQWVVELEATDARRLGSILGGAYRRPETAQGVDDIVGRLLIDWVTIDETSPMRNRTIQELEIRSRTGMTVIGIVRAERAITNPQPTTRIEVGDRVVVVGPMESLDRFTRYAKE